MNDFQMSEELQYYNMKAVVQETGLNPMTIRTWENRYDLPRPHRTEGGHRQYTQRDIEIFRWLIARQDEGISIRHAAETWHALEAEGKDPLLSVAEENEEIPTDEILFASDNQLDRLREQWIAVCLAFDRSAAEQILTQAFTYFPAEVVCIELLQKGVAQIGAGWYRGDVTVQQEHFATGLAVRRLEMLVAGIPQPLRSERILVFCAPEDHHVFSPLLLTFLLLRKGWDVIYLGANIPMDALKKTVAQVKPTLVVIAAQQLHSAANLLDTAKLLQEQDVTVGYGGTVFNNIPMLRQHIPGHFLGTTLQIALQRIESLVTVKEKSKSPTTVIDSDLHHQALQEFSARRTMIESHVWGIFNAENKPVKQLMQINADFAQTIMAALRLGNMELLGQNEGWVADLLVSYRPSPEFLHDYLVAYHQAARIHLTESGKLIVDWLTALIVEEGAT